MLTFRTFGTWALERHGSEDRPRPVALQPKRLGLLAYLVTARPCGFQRRDTLLALFWPESDVGHARNALSQALHGLRLVLGDAIETQGHEAVAVRRDAIRCEAVAFEQALDEGRSADAVELYRGELLAGLHAPGASGFERWLEGERRRFRRRAKDAMVGLADEAEREGNVLARVRWLERALEISPVDEPLVRRFITELDAAGDRGSALRAYERFARHLSIEYESEPSPETEALIEAVRERRKVSPGANPVTAARLPSVATSGCWAW